MRYIYVESTTGMYIVWKGYNKMCSAKARELTTYVVMYCTGSTCAWCLCKTCKRCNNIFEELPKTSHDTFSEILKILKTPRKTSGKACCFLI